MAKNTPQVRSNKLYILDQTKLEPLCCLDSPEWFAWLATAVSFRYFANGSIRINQYYARPMAPISVRKEKRRRGYLWYAYRRIGGKLYKRYVGRSADLTLPRLETIAAVLNEIW